MKFFRKRNTLVLGIVVCMMLLVACGKSEKGASMDTASEGYTSSSNMSDQDMKDSYDMGYDSYETEGEAPSEKASADGKEASGDTTLRTKGAYDRKIIKTGSINMRSKNVVETYDMLYDYVKSHGGYEFSKNQNASDDYITIYVTFKVLPETFDTMMQFAAGCGEIVSSNVSSDDITGDYYDTKVRLENKKRNLNKYYEYLEQANSLNETITLQNEIDAITMDIETLEGRLKMWDALVNESTIDIAIYQKNDPVVIEEKVDWETMSFEKMGRLMSNGFKKTFNVICSILQWFIIVVTTLLPLLILVGLVLMVVLLIRKKIVRKKKDGKTEMINKKDMAIDHKENQDL